MVKILTFDICALFIFIFVLAATFFRRMTKGRINQCFILLLVVGALSCIFDIGAIALDVNPSDSLLGLQFVCHTGYLYFHNLTPPLYLLYIVAQTDTFYRYKKNRAFIYYVLLPAVFFTAVLAINCFNGMVFSLDDCVYKREWFMNVLYILAISYAVLCGILLIKYRRLFTKTKMLSNMSLLPLNLCAVAVQFFYPAARIELFALAMGTLFIALFLQRPEAIIDFNTGIYKFSAYANDMNRVFALNKPVNVIQINIANFLSIQEILSYDSVVDLLREVADTMVSITDKAKIKADLYYLDKGRYRVVIGKEYLDRTEFAADAINAALKPKFPLGGMEVSMLAYVCIVKCPDDINDFNTIIEFGKDLSKLRFTGKVMYASEILDKSRYDLMGEIDRILKDAILNRKFEVYYQPIYSVSEGRFRSAEALIRLYDEKYGFISPEIFIPVTERNGTILKIGMFVFEEVCRFIASDDFKRLGLEYIEVNLSVIQCMQSGLAGDMLAIMKKYGVTSDQINLEITESADSQTQSIIAENLTALLNAGLSFSLDDFGTGYSNMQRMASLPLKIVKLDKTFVNFDNNPRLMIVLQNTVKMLKAMNMEIVVEGVETKELVERFTDLKCEYIQGYYFSRPVPKKEFVEFISSTL